jgi:hypothetical protein
VQAVSSKPKLVLGDLLHRLTVASKVVAKPPSTSAPAMSVLDNDPMSTGGHAHVRHLRSTDTEIFMAEDQPPL